jgi:hypothetical protein
MNLVLPATVREQPRPLPQGDDPAGPVLRCFCERCPRHPVIAGKRDQLLDVAVPVVPLLDQIGQVVWSPRGMNQWRTKEEHCQGWVRAAVQALTTAGPEATLLAN